MKRIVIAVTLAGVTLVFGDASRAQEWGGAAGVAASRGYTASSGISTTSYDDAPAPSAAPADAEALLGAPPGASAPLAPVVDLTAGVARHRGREGIAATRFRTTDGHRRRHPRAA